MNREDDPLKASGNLTYLQFIGVLKGMWEAANPKIPIVPTQGKRFAVYPCISYSLEVRKTSQNETKSRIRPQSLDPYYNNKTVKAQRYDNYIAFSVHTKDDPYLAETIIEEFENFMDEYTGSFKQLGLSEIVYARRHSDKEENRDSEDICVRTVAYLVTIEKITVLEHERIAKITIDARRYIKPDTPIPDLPDYTNVVTNITDTFTGATPNM